MSRIKKILKFFAAIGKKCLFGIDKVLLHGRFKQRLHRVEMDDGHIFLKDGEPYFIQDIKVPVQRAKILRVDTKDLITTQIYFSNQFRTWVMAVHTLYLEYLEEKNDVGLLLEQKLVQAIYGKNCLETYNDKIKSLRSQKWEEKEPMDVDRDLQLIDGSLRLAVAYYDKVEFIKVRCCDCSILRHRYVYGRDFLLSLGFSAKELCVVEEKVEDILEGCRYLNTCIIWPPARNMYEDLQKALQEYEPDNISVYDYWDTLMSFEEVKGFIEMAYKKDDTLTWALQMKSEFMYKASQIKDDKYPMRFVRIKMRNPDYIVKPVSGQPYSQESLRCKETLRAIFRSKVEYYERDVVIHISDNYLQSQYVWLLSHINRDLSALFRLLHEAGISYVATNEKDEPYNEKHTTFVLGNDARLVISTAQRHVNSVGQILQEFVHKHFNGQWMSVEKNDTGCNVLLDNESVLRIRIEPNAA